jgi:hypothetical protein
MLVDPDQSPCTSLKKRIAGRMRAARVGDEIAALARQKSI